MQEGHRERTWGCSHMKKGRKIKKDTQHFWENPQITVSFTSVEDVRSEFYKLLNKKSRFKMTQMLAHKIPEFSLWLQEPSVFLQIVKQSLILSWTLIQLQESIMWGLQICFSGSNQSFFSGWDPPPPPPPSWGEVLPFRRRDRNYKESAERKWAESHSKGRY